MTKTSSGTTITIEYELFDENGNRVALWQENRLGKFIREKLGRDIQRWPFGKPVDIRRS